MFFLSLNYVHVCWYVLLSDCYYRTETDRVHAELVRLDLSVQLRYPRETLLWAFRCRAVQTLLYIHQCTPVYCLKNRASCRFFFPWPEQQEQHDCETTQRLALRRRHAPDDQFVVPHNLELALFCKLDALGFSEGADQARLYACKYASKPEPWFYMETTRGERIQ